MVLIMCTILIVYLLVVISVIVALIKNKVQAEKVLHILSFHLSMHHCVKERKTEEKSKKLHVTFFEFRYN